MAFSAGRFYPGDHKGCQCQAVPVLLYPEAENATGRTGPLTIAPTDRFPGGLSVADSQAWMQNKWGTPDLWGPSGPPPGTPELGLRFDFRLYTREAANEAAAELDDLFREYPWTTRGIHVVTGPQNLKTWPANQGGLAERGTGTIRYGHVESPTWWTNTKNLAQQNSLGLTPWHPTGTAAWRHSVVSHEFGHHLYWRARSSGGEMNVRRAVQKVIEKYVGTKPPGAALDNAVFEWNQRAQSFIERNLSRYANSDFDSGGEELIAEAFASTRGTAPTEFAQDLIKTVLYYAEKR